MKLSAVVVISVNLVAATQLSANAADTASFLAETLSVAPVNTAARSVPLKAARKHYQAPAKKASQGHRGYVAMEPVIDGVKVRAFKPGRYLPSEADLAARREQASYQSMPARLDPAGIMAGSVSLAGESGLASPAYPSQGYPMSRPATGDYMPKVVAAVQKAKQVYKTFAASPRSIPGMHALMPGQIAHHAKGIVPEPFNFDKHNSGAVQIPQPPTRASAPMQIPNPATSNVAAAPYVVPSPSLTSYEAAKLQRIVESNLPENVYQPGFNGEMRAAQGNPGAGGGPPPFPLSVNPMQGRMGGRALSPSGMPVGQQARFGSWHGGSNLASAAFHTYVPVHMAGPASIKVNHFHGSHKTGKQAARPSASVANHSIAWAPQSKHAAAKKEIKHETPAASYPPYHRYSL